MKRTVRQLTSWLYLYVVKPILFQHKPDGVHSSMVRLTALVQRIPGVRVLPKLWAYQNREYLGQTIHGVYFSNPIGLSAGFDKQISMARMIKAVGFGWMTGGSVTWGEYKGNDGAWFYRLPKSKSLVVNAGLPSEGTAVVAQRVSAYSKQTFKDFPLSVSVAKTNSKATATDDEAVEDYCASLKEFDALKNVKMLEINISCPNTFGGEPFTTKARLEKLLSAVDALQLKKPVFIKMPINLPKKEFDQLLKVITKHMVTGVTIGNLFKDRRAAKLEDVLPEYIKGNLSGTPTREVTTELIRHTYKKYGDKLTIIGVGGVMNADDAYEKICAGATLVALITGLIYEGPQLAGTINYDLVKKLRRDGFSNISEAIGSESH
ncbi:MAG TPA: quinone-dependent dihydroorotate dehydrogenase [Candidatus Saccharibacteria bacterium]|nr:quinone-dependent dihydroorotate dehydrogenase [Candidatus Saccharibacteria bacterium]